MLVSSSSSIRRDCALPTGLTARDPAAPVQVIPGAKRHEERARTNSGSPALLFFFVNQEPVALRPRLATGVPFDRCTEPTGWSSSNASHAVEKKFANAT
jgi:hypothetical protein